MNTEKTAKYQVKHATIASTLVNDIRERILSGDIAQGEQLRQDVLATEHGVSRIPVREALLQLEAEGFVTYNRHKGAKVTSLSLDEINEVFDVRALIEVDMLKRAIPNWSEQAQARAVACKREFDKALDSKPVTFDLGELNWKFHLALYIPAERHHSMRLVQNLHMIASRYVRMQLLFAPGSFSRAKQEHSELLALCERKETAKAGRLLRSHIDETRAQLIDYLSTHRPGIR